MSAWGYGFAVHRVLKIHAYFTPVFTMAGISLILYAGGLAGVLRPAAYLVLTGAFCSEKRQGYTCRDFSASALAL